MPNKYFNVVLSISDGESSLPAAYIASVDNADRFDQEQLETAVLDAIATEQGFNHNGEYYETVALSGVSLSRIEEISEEDFITMSRNMKSFTCHVG